MSLASQLCPALPVFQCHGARDWSVPLRLGEVLHERTRARPGRAAEARFARAAQGGHDVLEDVRSELEAFWAAEVVRAAS